MPAEDGEVVHAERAREVPIRVLLHERGKELQGERGRGGNTSNAVFKLSRIAVLKQTKTWCSACSRKHGREYACGSVCDGDNY